MEIPGIIAGGQEAKTEISVFMSRLYRRNLRTWWREREAARAQNMNYSEGHLGGYIRARKTPAPSGLRIENGDPATWSPNLWRWAYQNLGVRSVLDVGCGEGHCARFFEDLGCDVVGIDGSKQAKRDSVIPDSHVVHDFVTGPYIPAGAFDLLWSCEFVEHVEERYSANFLATFSSSKRYIMMTYAAPGQGGWHHVNCQSAPYWIAKLRERGFVFAPDLTRESRIISEPGHFRAKGLVFVLV